MVKLVLDTPLCDHKHTITSHIEEDYVSIEVKTTCSKIKRKFVNDFKIPVDEATGLAKNSKIKDMVLKSDSICLPQCFVPPTVATASKIAVGQISMRYAKNVGKTIMKIKI